MSLVPPHEIMTQELYINSFDGTKLATYLFFPKDYQQATKTFPVIWKHDRYHSVNLTHNQAQLQTGGVDYNLFIKEAILRGFIVAIVDSRGSGCSFGHSSEPFSEIERADIKFICDWFAQQSWSNGKVGMYGRSYAGIIQILACINPSESLQAVIPEMAFFDLYDFVYPGGIFRNNFADQWGKNVFELDNRLPFKAVNGDLNLAQAAREEHRHSADVFTLLHSFPYRDSKNSSGENYYETLNPAHYISEINRSGLPIFQIAGWFDLWVKDALILHKNLTGSKKLLIGPWAHGGAENEFLIEQQFNWYAQYLLGANTAQWDEIQYYTIGAPKETAWKKTKEWPIAGTNYTTLFLTTQLRADSITNNDYLLSENNSTLSEQGSSHYEVNYTTTSGKTSRWANGYSGEYYYPDMESFCNNGLNYTTQSYNKDIEITGHPLVELYINANVPDIDLFVYLFDVYPDGYVQYLTEGCLRASRRKLIKPPYLNFALPYISGKQADLMPLEKDEPNFLKIDLHPTSYLLPKGHRLRVTITCCDKDNTYTPIIRPFPVLQLHSNIKLQSRLILPVIEYEFEHE